MLASFLVDGLVLVVALHRRLDDILFSPHLFKLHLLLLLHHPDEHRLRNESQSYALVAVPPCPAHAVDVGHRRHVLVLGGLAVVYDQGHCADVDAATDGFGAEEHLYFLVLEFGDPGGLGGRAVFGVEVVFPGSALGGAVAVDVVHFEVVFAAVGSLGVVDEELVLLLLEEGVEGTQFGNGVEEDDHLRLGLHLGQFLQNVEDDRVLVLGLRKVMPHALQPQVVILRVQLHDVVAHQVRLDELPELLPVPSRRSNQKLSTRAGTLAEQALFLGSAKNRKMSETSPRESSWSMSHSSRTTHLSSERSKRPDCANLVCIFLGMPTMMCPISKTVLQMRPILRGHLQVISQKSAQAIMQSQTWASRASVGTTIRACGRPIQCSLFFSNRCPRCGTFCSEFRMGIRQVSVLPAPLYAQIIMHRFFKSSWRVMGRDSAWTRVGFLKLFSSSSSSTSSLRGQCWNLVRLEAAVRYFLPSFPSFINNSQPE